jgi:hypothetical protein
MRMCYRVNFTCLISRVTGNWPIPNRGLLVSLRSNLPKRHLRPLGKPHASPGEVKSVTAFTW